MEEVSYLTLRERPRMDATQLETLCEDLGVHAAEDVLCRAMEDVALRLCQIQKLAIRNDRDALKKELHTLSAVAEQIGLRSVSSCARDVILCIDCHDGVAEAACLSRLARVGEGSLSALWDLQDLSV